MRKTADLPAREFIDLFSSGKATRAYGLLGCHYEPETGVHRFCVWAPHAKSVSVVGDFNNWDAGANPMLLTESNIWIALVQGLSDGENYKYLISGYDGSRVLKADPFAFHAQVRPGTSSKVWRLDGYKWSDQRFLKERAACRPVGQPVSVYELHPDSWRKKDGYAFADIREVADELSEYASGMGYTHVQLMAFLEHPLDESWGYQVTGYFAPTARYGTPQDYMYFVDRMHARGIGVIVSLPVAHFPGDEHGLAHFDGTWLYEYPEVSAHDTPHGGKGGARRPREMHAFNYASPSVRSFLLSAAMFLLDVYHIDGLCIDAVTSMLHPTRAKNGHFVAGDDGAEESGAAATFLRTLNETVGKAYPGAITVAGENASRSDVTRPAELGGLGFTFKWDAGFVRDTLQYMREDPYMRGYAGKLAAPQSDAFSESRILPYSHDEVANGKKSMLEKMYGSYAQKFAALRALYGYFFASPGKKLMFMGDEFGQFIEWDEKKQLDWFLLEYGSNAGLQKYVRRLNEAYGSYRALYEMDDNPEGFTPVAWDDEEMGVYAFVRHAPGEHLFIVCNFMPVMYESYMFALPEGGKLRLAINSDDAQSGGTGVLIPAKARVAAVGNEEKSFVATLEVPPLSTQYYEYVLDSEGERGTE